MDIKIVVDTGSDIPKSVAEKYDIGILSFISVFGEECYVSGVDMTNEEFYKKLEESDKIPTTSQTPYMDMSDYLKEQAKNHDAVIYFTLSSKGSGQYHTACLIRDELKEDEGIDNIYIADTMSYSLYIANTAVKAAKLAEEGKTPEEIIEYCDKYIKKWRAFLLVDTLKYLEKGGRINKANAIIGTLLDVKPVLTIENGLVEPYDKFRGKKKLVEKLIDKVKEDEDFDDENPEFLIVQSSEEKGRELESALKDEFGDESVKMYGEFGPIVGTHVGKGAFAVIAKIK